MWDMSGNHIVGFPMRRLIYMYMLMGKTETIFLIAPLDISGPDKIKSRDCRINCKRRKHVYEISVYVMFPASE